MELETPQQVLPEALRRGAHIARHRRLSTAQALGMVEPRSRGFGFFEDAGFYPSFLVWLVDDAQQTVWFVDPTAWPESPPPRSKLRLAQEIRQKHEARLAVANLHLGATIVSEPTYLQTMVATTGWSQSDSRERSLYFMDSGTYNADLLHDMANAPVS